MRVQAEINRINKQCPFKWCPIDFGFRLPVTASFACGNGTRNFTFDFVDGVQSLSYSTLEDFVPIYSPRFYLYSYTGPYPLKACTPLSIFWGLTNMLSGNTSFQLKTNPYTKKNQVDSVDTSSRILLTGLDACDSFANNEWNHHPLFWYNSTPLDGNNLTSNLSTNLGIIEFEGPINISIATPPSWMCRNHSLQRAIEDLATNITISMLTQADLTYVSFLSISFLSFS
jgi:hypothetical protein